MNLSKFLWPLFLALVACDPPTQPPTLQQIAGRDGNPLFFISQPKSWKRVAQTGDLQDTKAPIAEWLADDAIKITLHTFPIEPKRRIPPMAQVQRWRGQINPLLKERIEPQSFAGFSGIVWEGEGSDTLTFAWSMHLGKEHENALQEGAAQLQDWTFKVVGPKQLVEKIREDIFNTARSVEFIEAIYE